MEVNMAMVDISFLIMSLVDLPTLVAMRLVCRQFAHVAAHESMWQRRVIANLSSIRNSLLGCVLDRRHHRRRHHRSRFTINCLAEAIDATITNLEAVRARLFGGDSQVVDASNDFKVTLVRLPGAPNVLGALRVGQYICAAFPVPGTPRQGFTLRHAIVIHREKRCRDNILAASVKCVGQDGHLPCTKAADFIKGSYAVYLVTMRTYGEDERAADRAQAWEGSIYSVHSDDERVWNAASFCLFCQTGAYVRPDVSPTGHVDSPPHS